MIWARAGLSIEPELGNAFQQRIIPGLSIEAELGNAFLQRLILSGCDLGPSWAEH